MKKVKVRVENFQVMWRFVYNKKFDAKGLMSFKNEFLGATSLGSVTTTTTPPNPSLLSRK